MTPSTTNLRPLLPRSSKSPDKVTTPSDITGLPPRRRVSRTKVVTACRPCRKRKIKCDSALPQCGVRRYKMRNCGHPDEEALAGNLVKKQKALQDNVDSFTSLFRYLQDRPASEANNLFERIRNGLSIDSALDFVKAEGNNSTLAYRNPAKATVKSTQTKDCKVLLGNHTLSIEASDAAVQALQHGVDCFFSYLGTMFPIYTKSEVDLTMNTFLASESSPDDMVDKRVAYGELLAICALGLQYGKQTSSNGSANIYRGILIGSSTGLNVGERPSYLSESEFKGYIKTLKALITVRSWVTATLGHIPNPEISRCIHETREQMDDNRLDCTGEGEVIDMLQQKMAQITNDLELWRSSLAVYMRREALLQSPTISPDQRCVIFYMHLFYMSALILKARALLATQGEIVTCSRDSEAASAIIQGVHAARSSARLLALILDEKAVVKNCWLTIFLVGGASLSLQQDITRSDKCVEIPKLCATRDRIAHAFHVRISEYQDILKGHLPTATADEVDSGASVDDSPDSSYLFAQTYGTTELDRLMQELRAMLCYPLNLLKGRKKTSIHYPTIVEASVNADINFAQHLTLSFGRADDCGPIGLSPRSNSPRGSDGFEKEVEGYVGGSVPYDWEILPGIKCAGFEVGSRCSVQA